MARELPDWMNGAVELKKNWYLLPKDEDGSICLVFTVADDWVYTLVLDQADWEAAFKAVSQGEHSA